MRLFVAIEIPESAKDDLVGIQTKVDSSIAKIRFVNKSQMHLTLKFLGKVSKDKVDSVKEKLKEIKFEPFSLGLDDIGVFPSENYVRVIWVGVEPREEVVKLQEKIEKVLECFDFKKDFEFHPHITLARVKFVNDKEKFIKNLKEIKVEEKKIEIKDFRLVKSNLTPKGPVYEDVSVFA
jgi:2'-5' RNA ligase